MNVKKQFRVSSFIRKTTALNVHQTLWYISLASTHDYGMILTSLCDVSLLQKRTDIYCVC